MKLTKKMVDALCVKWKYPDMVKGMKDVEIPDPDPEAEEGATITEPKEVMVPNPQSKEEFVQEYTDNFVVNEYRIQHRKDKKDVSDEEADEDVDMEVELAKEQ